MQNSVSLLHPKHQHLGLIHAVFCLHFHVKLYSFCVPKPPQSKRARTQIRKQAIDEIEKKLREVFARGYRVSYIYIYIYIYTIIILCFLNNAQTGYFEL